jgi:hypothetical protein
MGDWARDLWFRPDTMVRCVTTDKLQIEGISSPSETGSGAAATCMFMPLSTLFPDGASMAFDGTGTWISAYK